MRAEPDFEMSINGQAKTNPSVLSIGRLKELFISEITYQRDIIRYLAARLNRGPFPVLERMMMAYTHSLPHHPSSAVPQTPDTAQ